MINNKSIKAKGFTLVELMVVVAILGILASVAYPEYTSRVQKSKRADAINSLVMLAGRMEEYYMNNDSYTGVGDDVTTLLGDDQSLEGYYTIAIDTQTPFGFTISANPNFTDNRCGELSYDSLGVKGVEFGTVAKCW